MTKSKRPILLVEFLDSTHDPGWKDEDKDFRGCALCQVVGFKMQADRKCMVLAMMRSGEGNCSERMVIPRGAIINIEVLGRK